MAVMIMGPLGGTTPNPHVLYGQADMENRRVELPRIGTRWGDMQLSNGWDRTNYGHRMTMAAASYRFATSPSIPGQTRLSGTQKNNYPIRGLAPSQWDNYVAMGPGSQPNYPGGPGQLAGNLTYRGNSGG